MKQNEYQLQQTADQKTLGIQRNDPDHYQAKRLAGAFMILVQYKAFSDGECVSIGPM